MTDKLKFTIGEESYHFTLGEKYETGGGAKLPIDYEDRKQLINRPHINYKELIGNKTSEELGLQDTIEDITNQDIDSIIYGG